MTSLVIIPETTPKVNPKPRDNGTFPPLSNKNTSHPVTVKYCEAFNPDPHATNSWTAERMSFQWHGDDVASFDDEIHTLVERDSKQAIFRHIDQPTTRVIMCAELLSSIIQRTTYDLRTHNGEITFVNGKAHTFRAYTNDDGQRVVQEKRGKKKWKLFGDITPDGTVTPIIPSYLPKLAADDDQMIANEAANARRKIRIIQAKANLINDPLKFQDKGVAVNFKGSCRCCNRVLSNPKSVADGIGPTCARLESQAAVSMPTVQAVISSELRQFDFEEDTPLPLTAEEVLFCTSQLGAMGCSDAEVEQFFADLLLNSPHWYPNFIEEATKHDKSLDFLHDVCDAFVYSITPVDDYVRIANQLFRYQRFGSGYEFISLMGSRDGEIVELAAYPHEVQQVVQELAWA